MMSVAPELSHGGGFEGLSVELDEATLSRVRSEHLLPGSLMLHWHADSSGVDPPSLVQAEARNMSMRFSRYAAEASPRSWLGVLAARHSAMAVEKAAGVCAAIPVQPNEAERRPAGTGLGQDADGVDGRRRRPLQGRLGDAKH